VKYYNMPYNDKSLVAKLVGKINWYYRDKGKDKQVIQKRDFFGQKFAFNDNEVYTNTATALEDTKVFLLYKDDVETLMENDKNIGFRMFKKLLKMLYKRAQNER
ncbi:MAG: cyclic nucleotide-binding domain-containing protein, partial [Endomicrobiaceae bacterium]|nr:cyclic nucleotide-binding domain-containing protein [Endomicrobiaceae bacterium]